MKITTNQIIVGGLLGLLFFRSRTAAINGIGGKVVSLNFGVNKGAIFVENFGSGWNFFQVIDLKGKKTAIVREIGTEEDFVKDGIEFRKPLKNDFISKKEIKVRIDYNHPSNKIAFKTRGGWAELYNGYEAFPVFF